ncbi:MAG: hypothetical protein JKY22_05430, partial [Flavobacteriaceae bacterium]|nr:hypothetical protein [Flavobacteriaceae bacterium]
QFFNFSGVKVGKAFFKDSGGTVEEFQIFATNLDKILQNVDYKYNVRGWLTDINDLSGISLNTDLFHFQINYNNTTNSGSSVPLYNGNISQTFWRTTHDQTHTRGYEYHYDDLNRITEANSFKGAGLNNMTNTGNYKVNNISYDLNGNILSLTRFGSDNSNSPPAIWDNLLYSYSGNKLMEVEEQTTSFLINEGFIDGYTGLEDEYEYDLNGNMTKDRNKGIDNITYNHLNLPLIVTINNGQGSGTILYIYDATGFKLQKTFTKSGMTPKITQYAGNFMYDDTEISGTMKLQFFNHPEGYVVPVTNTDKSVKGSFGGVTTYSSYSYVFQFKDI